MNFHHFRSFDVKSKRTVGFHLLVQKDQVTIWAPPKNSFARLVSYLLFFNMKFAYLKKGEKKDDSLWTVV